MNDTETGGLKGLIKGDFGINYSLPVHIVFVLAAPIVGEVIGVVADSTRTGTFVFPEPLPSLAAIFGIGLFIFWLLNILTRPLAGVLAFFAVFLLPALPSAYGKNRLVILLLYGLTWTLVSLVESRIRSKHPAS